MGKETGALIREMRIKKNLTQKQLGEKCGIADSAVRKYESGKVQPKLDMIKKLANALDCNFLDLIVSETYENASKDEKAEIRQTAFHRAVDRTKKNDDICEIAGYKLELFPKKEDRLIHLTQLKSNIEIAVDSEQFKTVTTEIINYIEYNFSKLTESAKVINNGNEENKG